jgi:DNA-binding winged helix-turn-helix (wHTH) protein/tetratricopeptide (TPR) repeat protein
MKDMRNRTFRFDNVEIDVQNLRVTVGSEIRPLEPKSFRLFLLLVENPGRVLTKDEIMAAVWPDVAVSDNSLARAIAQIRRALDDDPKSPRYIETVPTVGYRFVGNSKDEPSPPAPSEALGGNAALVVASTPAVAPIQARSYARAAIAGGVVTVIALAAGLWLLTSRKAQALTNKDTIVLADFANSTGDPVFDDALKQGLAVQLSQSPLLNILPDQRVRSALKEMTRSPDEILTANLAQEVCVRTGSKAYIVGSIANLGGHYVIGLNAMHCATGDTLARDQTEAGDKQQVIAALSTVAGRLRNRLGESLNSIRKYDVPLAQATTSSLEALKAYSLGLAKYAKGEQASAVPLFQKAVELDPDFAIAYANLGRAYQVLGRQERMEEALRRAFALRNRTSEREKYDISAGYYQFITNQTDETIQNCELWAQTYPLDFTPHRILGFENAVLGRFDQSAKEFGKAKELDPSQALPYGGLIFDYMALNRLTEARATYQEVQARMLDFGEPDRDGYLLAFLDGDKETMAKVAAALAGQPGYEARAFSEESRAEAYFGRLKRSRELSQKAEDAALATGDKTTAAAIEATAAFAEALFGDSAGARDRAAAALSLGGRTPVASVRAGDSVQPAVALALAGDSVLAARVADSLASDSPPDGVASRVWLPEIRAAIELKRGSLARAAQLLTPVTPYEAGWSDNFLAAYLLGEAYLAERRGPEAAAEFQKIVDHRGVVLSSPIGALAHLGLARSYALEGDTTKAGAAYRDFLTLWKDADAEIPILIAAKTEFANLK